MAPHPWAPAIPSHAPLPPTFIRMSFVMRTMKIAFLLVVVILGAALPRQARAGSRFDELRVRTILADISHGGPVAYYAAHPEDPNAVQAVRRWRTGIRVVNADRFERRIVDGTWAIVYAGTRRRIDPRDVRLTTDEARVRTILVDITHGGPVAYYEAHPNDPPAVEAVRRWKGGVRVANASRFERRIVNGQWALVYAGTTRRIDPADIRLTTDQR